jgi:hypothetical protein
LGGGALLMATQTPAEQIELKENFPVWADSGCLAETLVPVFALAETVKAYCPFHAGSLAKAAGARNEPPNGAAVRAIKAVVRYRDNFPPQVTLA